MTEMSVSHARLVEASTVVDSDWDQWEETTAGGAIVSGPEGKC